MDIDHLKPATEDKMEMNMDNKLLDFYRDVVSYNPSHHDEFTTANIVTNTSAEVQPHFIENAPCSFMSLPNSRISFSGGNNSSPNIHQASLLSNPRWRGSGGGGELCDHSKHIKKNSMAAMREMIFQIAAMQPIHIDPESVKPPKRRNVKISKDPQSVAARHRRERISERIRILQRLVPGGTKMDTASMLDEAVHYVKFLKNQLQSLERSASVRSNNTVTAAIGLPVAMSNNGSYANPVLGNNTPYHHHHPPDHSYHRQGLQHYGAA